MPFKPGKSGNPKGRPKLQVRQDDAIFKEDGWMNIVSGLGGAKRDKRVNHKAHTTLLSFGEAKDLYRADGMAAKVVELPVKEMFRPGFNVSIQLEDQEDETRSKKLQEKIEQTWKNLGVVNHLSKQLCRERAFGGCALLIGFEDGSKEMFRELESTQGEFRWLYPLERDEMEPVTWYDDPSSPKFGKVETWRVTPHNFRFNARSVSSLGIADIIHETRLIVFEGDRVTNHPGGYSHEVFGDSIFVRLISKLQTYNHSYDSMGALFADFAQAVLKMEGLKEILGADNKKAFQNRIEALDIVRSLLNMMVIGENDEFVRTQTPLAGLADTFDRISEGLAAEVQIPVTLLFGRSPGGLNSTGDSDTAQWHSRLATERIHKIQPPLERITDLILISLGESVETPYSIEFGEFQESSDKEKAETRSIQAQTDERYVNMGAISEDEIRIARFSSTTYNYETVVGTSTEAMLERESEREADQQMEAEMRQAELEQMKAPQDGVQSKDED